MTGKTLPKFSYIRRCQPLLPQSSSPTTLYFQTASVSHSQLAHISRLVHSGELDTNKCDIFAGDAGFCLDGSKAVISSKEVVEELYGALERRDCAAVRQLLNPDVDWWFHGPRAHQHLVLMRLLTGRGGGLPFEIQSLDAFGSTVLAEGTDATGALYWVHAWTVGPCGRVTEVREYCNTALVVTRLGGGGGGSDTEVSAAPAATKNVCSRRSQQVWQSRLPDQTRRNLPGLVLAI